MARPSQIDRTIAPLTRAYTVREAAPELLAACIEVLGGLTCRSLLDKPSPLEGCGCWTCDMARTLGAAIAKAERGLLPRSQREVK